jgi:hypothetical protein
MTADDDVWMIVIRQPDRISEVKSVIDPTTAET